MPALLLLIIVLGHQNWSNNKVHNGSIIIIPHLLFDHYSSPIVMCIIAALLLFVTLGSQFINLCFHFLGELFVNLFVWCVTMFIECFDVFFLAYFSKWNDIVSHDTNSVNVVMITFITLLIPLLALKTEWILFFYSFCFHRQFVKSFVIAAWFKI